jgi:hypothetical protein
MYSEEIRPECLEWIHLVRDREKCWALVNTKMNLRIPQETRLAERLLVSHR